MPSSGILSSIVADILFGILSIWFRPGGVYCDLALVVQARWCPPRSGTCGGGGGGGEEEEERTALIKSNNHYLAGGEKDKRKCPCA